MIKSLFVLCMFFIVLLPISLAQEVWEGYGQEIIDTIIVTEDITEEGNIDLDKTGENMPSDDSSSSSSSSSSSGGGTTIINNYYQIEETPLEEEKSSEDTTSDDEETPIGESEKSNEEKATSEDKKEDALAGIVNGITGATASLFKNIKSNSLPVGIVGLILVVIVLVILGVHPWRGRKPSTVEPYYENEEFGDKLDINHDYIMSKHDWDFIGLGGERKKAEEKR